MIYNPEASPPMSDTNSQPTSKHRVLRSVALHDQQPSKTNSRVRKPAATACTCETQLTELRREVSELTKTINEMNNIVHAKLLFPHLSLSEALADDASVTYDHVKPPKRPRSDSALYLPDIPDGFSDSTAHSLVFRRRTKATTTEQECRVASRRLRVGAAAARENPESDTIVVKGGVHAHVAKRGKVAKRGRPKRGRPPKRTKVGSCCERG